MTTEPVTLEIIANKINLLAFAVQGEEANFSATVDGEMIRATNALAPGHKLSLRMSLLHINKSSGEPFDSTTSANSITLILRDSSQEKLKKFSDLLDKEIQLAKGDRRDRGTGRA